jgi:Protein of unknown function (DUF1592)/Protein of unknown function (DUF1588)/Protein of unknown function (DUF1585)/Protein of unknown function (DUF1587)/Protein of unknown function (DUF1595)/Cytochrome C oxidase, cbb3-type, subunit III
MSCRIPLAILLVAACPAGAADEPRAAGEAAPFLKAYCLKCHDGEKPKGGVHLARLPPARGVAADPKTWDAALVRVRDGEMPPKGSDQPPPAEREQFVEWVKQTLNVTVCGAGARPGPAPLRRLNRSEYAATVRDLLGIQFSAAQKLPEDGAGGEGFDNAAETLKLSPLHAEKYLEAAREALDYAAKEPRTRSRLLTARPTDDTPPAQAARTILERFLPRAFRRPARDGEVDSYLALFEAAHRRGDSFDQAVLFAMQGVMISPHFLFRLEEPNPTPAVRLVGDYEIASRLSYFLWGSMPDDQLLRLAGEGKLNDPDALRDQAVRMLKDAKVRESAESFVEQWLGTRELGRNGKPDPSLHRNYTGELEWAIKKEPVLFFQGLLAENRPLLDLIDANYSYLDTKLTRHYGFQIRGTNQQLKKYDLPEGSHRGGILTMAAVLAVSSHPHRTSPVLRGKWVRETLLGSPPPPAPPDVPEFPEKQDAAAPKTVRERLEQHRQNPTCAACHARIDPIGFGLENYDALGRWRTEESGKPVDAKGELPDGTTFDGPQELKQVLLKRKDEFVRHLTTKLLGYALGRGLTVDDRCTVEEIVTKVKEGEYTSHALVVAIVRSVPFRYRAGESPAPTPPPPTAPTR